MINNGTHESSTPSPATGSTRNTRSTVPPNDLERLKHDLLKAELSLARARATMAGAEVDVKVLTARLKALT